LLSFRQSNGCAGWRFPRIDPEKSSAKFDNGVFEISMPLPQSTTAKRVPIETGTDTPKQLNAA
jgi:hypothetical protein